VTQTVEKDKVVAIKYTLKDEAGEIVDRSGDEPMEYLHGAGNIVPGLEKQLTGKSAGDTLVAKVSPEEGYGPKHDVKPQQIPRSAFPSDAKLEKGMSFSMSSNDGRTFPIWITKIQGPTVTVSPNHPLAGQSLHFDVEVVSVRDAHEEEIAHGHPHGPGGHHHHDHDHGDGEADED
jgi:FKBP-type peptidyl-prolyl cis-trans isomerase SlyD